ncbi:SRPBCC family protein [Actinopolymorpha sp. B17G11]|uniref:SRPBCC family protein n=1 Tax=Actinopolymorpha sp. B17G11 TaxID=3160861 RepID=UPI0032E4BA15
MNETLLTVDGRPMLRIERRLGHPPEKVWRAVTEPAELSQWFPATVEMELELGAKVSFDMGDEGGPSVDGTIVELDRPRVFAFTWVDDLLRWELRPHDDGCLLVFTHTFDDRFGAASFASGWRQCLDALELLLAGQPIHHVRPSAELHDSLVTAFGLDEGTVEATPGGWRVRFERQVTQPAESVWKLLVSDGADALAVGGAVPGEFTVAGFRPGAVTAVERQTVLEYSWYFDGDDAPADTTGPSGAAGPSGVAGTVRWELTTGTGHGARLILSQTGPEDLVTERSRALAAWRSRIDELAAQLRGMAD